MPILVIDGPEKAGKSTVARILAEEHGARVRHFGAEPSAGELYDLVFYRALLEDTRDPGLVVWDRSWASEVVYGGHYCRARRLVSDPWLAEWLYGRLVSSCGLRVMLLGPSAVELQARRTPDDHDMPVGKERGAFAVHAWAWKWDSRQHLQYNTSEQQLLASFLVERAYERAAQQPLPVPHYVGPSRPRVLVVGESRNAWGRYPGALAPFTSWYTTRFGRLFGDRAMDFGWTNADVLTDSALESMGSPLVVACGSTAQRRLAGSSLDVFPVPHPAWFYRWGSAQDRVPTIERRLLEVVGERLVGVAA